MESQVAGAVAVGLLAAVVGCYLWAVTAAVGLHTGLPVTGADTTLSGDWDSGAVDGTVMQVGAVLVLLVSVGGGVAWYLGTSRQSGTGETVKTDSQVTESAPGASAVETGGERQMAVTEELSNEQRVRELLEANDGQMKQARVVENTDWSKSKVSMVLSEMESEGEISKLRVGRENLISLAGEEPEAAGSPFDDLRE
jgi:uncharacterized membrane protein